MDMAGPVLPRRPRLSLQTVPGPNIRSSRGSLSHVDPKSPTAFNTLSNVYVTAIERSTPVQSTPVTAIHLTQPLKLQTDPESLLKGQHHRVHTPFTATLPDTPLSANPLSPAQQHMDILFPSSMTATPPLSAGPTDSHDSRMFTFAPSDTHSRQAVAPTSPAQTRRRLMYGPFGGSSRAPYSHNRGLHSILRNSPLPPPSAISPVSERRQSARLQEKAARRVGYESPLTQTITTERYIKSHIDLLAEEASPYTTSPIGEDINSDPNYTTSDSMVLDLAMAYSGDETRDGGQTPGPFEEMRRRMNGLATTDSMGTTPILSPRSDGGVRKRTKRREKRRRWVWTIGQEDGEDAQHGEAGGSALAVTPRPRARSAPAPVSASVSSRNKATTPEPLTAVQISVESAGSSESDDSADRMMDVEISDSSSMLSSRATTPSFIGMDLDAKTPTVYVAPSSGVGGSTVSAVSGLPGGKALAMERLGSVDWINPETGSRRDTPIPPDLVNE